MPLVELDTAATTTATAAITSHRGVGIRNWRFPVGLLSTSALLKQQEKIFFFFFFKYFFRK
jgi:hypothetical protein